MGVSAVIGGVASAAGSFAQGNAARKAASSQRHAADAANQTQREFYGDAKNTLDPYIKTGNAASQKISDLEGLNGGNSSTIQQTLSGLPGYQFANTQGLKATQNAASARGLGTSGAALKGAANYTTGLANQYYNNYLTGIQDTQHTGANAASSLAGDAISTGAGIANTTVGAGNATAAGQIAQGNAFAGAANAVPSALLAKTLFDNNGNDPNGNGKKGGLNYMNPNIFNQNTTPASFTPLNSY